MGSLRERSSSQEESDNDHGWKDDLMQSVIRFFSTSGCSSSETEDRSMKQLVSSIECQPIKARDGEPPRCAVVYTDFERSRSSQFWLKNKGILLSALLALLSLTFFCIMSLTSIYDNAILKLVSIRNDIDTVFDLWRMPPTSPTLSVYPFNYSNYDKVLRGEELPVVQEVGPYVFREKGEKVNIKFNDNATVSFQEKKTIKFAPELTKGSLEDMINVPNIPLIVVLNRALESMSVHYAEQKLITYLLTSMKAEPFQRISVNDFIWGSEDAFFKALKEVVKTLENTTPDRYGFLLKRRGIHHDIVTMKTGEDDLNLVGSITRWNGADRIGKWGNTSCDSLTGSEGSLYGAESVSQQKRLYVYSKDMCRRFPLYFNKTTTSRDGFPVQQYNVGENIFDFSGKNEDNICFKYKGKYPPTGAFNTEPCQNGSPIFVSFPHFWTGGEELRSKIKGLNPDPEKHRSYFHIHKNLGLSLLVKTRFQLNIMLQKSKFITQTSNLKADKIILPIAWLDYDSGELPEHFVNIIYHLTYTVRIVEYVLKWFLFLCTMISMTILALLIKRTYY